MVSFFSSLPGKCCVILYNNQELYECLSNNIEHRRLARWRKWKSCDVGEAKEGLENELWHRWKQSSAHSPSFQSLHLRHSSFWFSKLSVTSSTSQLILQSFPRFTYVTTHCPILLLLRLRHSSFSNPSFASPTSQALHLRHLASRLCSQIRALSIKREKVCAVCSYLLL